MLGDEGTLDRKESSSTHMETDVFHVDSLGLDPAQDILCEMQSRRRCGHRPSDMGIESLIALQVDLLRFPVQVRRDRDGPADLQDTGERRAVRPPELHYTGLALTA